MATVINSVVLSGDQNGFRADVGGQVYVFPTVVAMTEFVGAYFAAWQVSAAWSGSYVQQGTDAAAGQMV
jgi:hypothetical protein